MQTVSSTLRRSTPIFRFPIERPVPMEARQGDREYIRTQVLGERTRIAREIHDVLAHSIGALGIQIEAARSVLFNTGDVAAALDLLEEASRLADDGLSETRQAIHALRIDTPPLSCGLATLAGSHEQHYHRPVALCVSGRTRPISRDANAALFRVAREALTNAARHAPGNAVTMHLEYTDRHVSLTLTNPLELTAVAADCAKVGSERGYGILGMRERLKLTGGTLSAGQADNQWIVRAQVPL
jgi:signal transduction histidine kinase